MSHNKKPSSQQLLPTVSVIVPTYNYPQALNAILIALEAQTDAVFEVIVGDDGSTSETAELVQAFQQRGTLNLHYVYQEDKGFRAARIRNLAALKATGELLVFIDGDCIPPKDFIVNQKKLAEPGWFVVGNRILTTQKFARAILEKGLPVHLWGVVRWLRAWLSGGINRFLPTLKFIIPRKRQPQQWEGAKTCNLAIFRSDFFAVDGLDERYEGWGFEDSDLVIRLINYGCRRKSGKFAVPVIHLWHENFDRARSGSNFATLEETSHSGRTQAQMSVLKFANACPQDSSLSKLNSEGA